MWRLPWIWRRDAPEVRGPSVLRLRLCVGGGGGGGEGGWGYVGGGRSLEGGLGGTRVPPGVRRRLCVIELEVVAPLRRHLPSVFCSQDVAALTADWQIVSGHTGGRLWGMIGSCAGCRNSAEQSHDQNQAR